MSHDENSSIEEVDEVSQDDSIGDCLPPLVPTKRAPRLKRSPGGLLPETPVLPAVLLHDDEGTMLVSVGDKATKVAALGAEEWPLPNELLLLLEPELQPEVLAEVGLGDQ